MERKPRVACPHHWKQATLLLMPFWICTSTWPGDKTCIPSGCHSVPGSRYHLCPVGLLFCEDELLKRFGRAVSVVDYEPKPWTAIVPSSMGGRLCPYEHISGDVVLTWCDICLSTFACWIDITSLVSSVSNWLGVMLPMEIWNMTTLSPVSCFARVATISTNGPAPQAMLAMWQ